MPENIHHEHLIKELTQQFQPVFTNSPQGVYLYLDDTHKSCNQNFADMLGYSSPEEWIANVFPISDVDQKDQEKGVMAYMNASKNLKASAIPATWTKKDGTKIKTMVMMVPITYQNEVFVLHFITEENNSPN